MMFNKQYYLLLLLCIPACGTSSPLVTKPFPTIVAGPHGYLALGDSYTIGHGVEENERWPNLLVEALRGEHVELSAPHIIARTGWTTTNLQDAINQRSFTGTFKLVTLQIGVNDQYSKASLTDFRPRFNQLLTKAIELTGNLPTHVVVLSIPDYNYGPHRKFAPENISESIDQFNLVCKDACLAKGVTFIDITPLSRAARDDKELWAVDQLHFSGKMYHQWVNHITPVVKQQLHQQKNASP